MIAKFKVTGITETKDEAGQTTAETYYMQPVYSDDPNHVNYSWSKLTPAGSLNITITNPNLFGHFKRDQEVQLTFSTLG
jgi:hypothetical protein